MFIVKVLENIVSPKIEIITNPILSTYILMNIFLVDRLKQIGSFNTDSHDKILQGTCAFMIAFGYAKEGETL